MIVSSIETMNRPLEINKGYAYNIRAAGNAGFSAITNMVSFITFTAKLSDVLRIPHCGKHAKRCRQ